MRIVTVKLNDNHQITDVDFVAWIMNEIEGKVYTRADVAKTYAILMQKETPRDQMVRVNEAILKRWGPSGFRWIKEQAWRQATAA